MQQPQHTTVSDAGSYPVRASSRQRARHVRGRRLYLYFYNFMLTLRCAWLFARSCLFNFGSAIVCFLIVSYDCFIRARPRGNIFRVCIAVWANGRPMYDVYLFWKRLRSGNGAAQPDGGSARPA